MKGTPAKMKEAFSNLEIGFRYSLIALILCLILLILVPFYHVFLHIVIGLPFGILSTWIYSLIKRSRGWKLLNEEKIAYALRLGSVIIFLFLFPLSPLTYYSIFYCKFPMAPLAWAIYTVLENLGFESLERKYGMNLKSSRLLNLTGILVYAFALLLFYLFPISHPLYWYAIAIPSLVPAAPFLFAAPFLVACCILVIKGFNISLSSCQGNQKPGFQMLEHKQNC